MLQNKTVVIIQARMTSTRLPGKVMLPLGSMTVLGHVLKRSRRIKGVDIVCCAIPYGQEHDIIETETKLHGCVPFRGSETNVLQRYFDAAHSLNATTIMRITSDCPLFDCDVASKVLALHHDKNSRYTCNNMPQSWPHGFDCEVFGINELEECMKNACEPGDFEHVTPWMRRTYNVSNYANPKGNQYSLRLTLDTPEDYIFIKNYYNSMKHDDSL